jgi:YD repeat-containing protein
MAYMRKGYTMYLYDELNAILTHTEPDGKRYTWAFCIGGYTVTITWPDSKQYTYDIDNMHNMRSDK